MRGGGGEHGHVGAEVSNQHLGRACVPAVDCAEARFIGVRSYITTSRSMQRAVPTRISFCKT
jgi:hypothetical protein